MYDAYIYDSILICVFTVHLCVMHISMTLDFDTCVYGARMYDTCIHDLRLLTLMHVYHAQFRARGISTLLKIKTGHMYSYVKLNVKASLFSCIFLI